MNDQGETQSFESFLRSTEDKNQQQNGQICSSGSSINYYIDKNKTDLFNYQISSRGSINNNNENTYGMNPRNFGGSNHILKEAISKAVPMKGGTK